MGQPEIHNFDIDAVNSAANRQLYKKREPIYPKLVHGKYRFLKWVVLACTLGVYYLLPWLRWSRGPNEPDQAVLVDFEGQRFYFFFIEIWPNELYFVTGLLVLGALALFFATSLYGRLWCGYTCPQTVWTDLFIAIERLVEGDRNQRIKLAKQDWNAQKISRKVIKHFLWLVVAAATGGAWVLYFHDAPTVIENLFTGTAPTSAYLFLAILTFTTYTLAGIMREQVCIYMCPWPRIQAAMTDADTFSVGYYAARGEPRGKLKKADDGVPFGDCIDCKACVAACPMGIDIREGDQLECIDCGLCVDACDDIMKKIDRPIGLIAYGADYRIEHPTTKRKTLPNFIRPRTIFYGSLIVIVSAIMLYGLNNRAVLEMTVERNRSPAYVVLSDGTVRNAINVRLVNKQNEAREFELQIDGPEGLEVSGIGHTVEGNKILFSLPGDGVQKARLFLNLSSDSFAAGDRDVTMLLTDKLGGETVERNLTIIGKEK